MKVIHLYRLPHFWLQRTMRHALIAGVFLAPLICAAQTEAKDGSLPVLKKVISSSLSEADYSKDISSADSNLLRVAPPIPATLEADQEVEWQFSELAFNGSSISGFQPDEAFLRQHIRSKSLSVGAYNALSKHLGDKISSDRGLFAPRTIDALAQIRGNAAVEELSDFSCKLKGTVSRWIVSGNRELQPSEANGRVLADASGDKRIYYLYSPSTWALVEIRKPRGAADGSPWLSPDASYPGSRDFSGFRLITLSTESAGSLEISWSAGSPLQLRKFDGRASPGPLAGPSAMEALETWLAAHPVPAKESSNKEVSAWLHQFLLRIPLDQSRNNPFLQEYIVSVAGTHPAALVEAFGKHDGNAAAKLLALAAIPKSLLRDAALYPGKLGIDDYRDGLKVGDARYSGALGRYAAEAARRGGQYRVECILFAAPQSAGLSHTEWLDFFRNTPCAFSYEVVRRMGVSEADLATETAALLELQFPIMYQEGNVLELTPSGQSERLPIPTKVPGWTTWKGSAPDVELALTSGHPKAVAWYRRCFQSHSKGTLIQLPSITLMGIGVSNELKNSLPRYFVIPDEILVGGIERQTDWFLSHPPEHFHFDYVQRKFRLK